MGVSELRVSGVLINEFMVEVPWGHIAVKAHGDPSTSPVLCIHGKQDNASSFDTLIPLLPSSFYYVAIDLPCHGLSSHFAPGKVLDMFDFALVINRVVRHFSWDHFQIIGHSLGAMVGLMYTSLFPLRVTTLILLDPMFEYKSTNEELVNHILHHHEKLLTLEKNLSMKSPPSYTKEEVLRRIQENRPGIPLSKQGAQILFPRSVKVNQGGLCFRADQRLKLAVPTFYTSEQMMQIFARVKCPLLCLRASLTDLFTKYKFNTCDAIFRETLGKLYEFKIYEGGHDVHLEEPEKVASDVSRYLILTKSSL